MMIALLGASLLAALGLGWGWERTRKLSGSMLWWTRGLLLMAGLAALLMLGATALFVKIRNQPPKPAPVDTTIRRNA